MRWPMMLILTLTACSADPPRPSRLVFDPPPPFCTRTLGMATCFADPDTLPDHPASLGDAPYRPLQPPTPWWQRVADYWN